MEFALGLLDHAAKWLPQREAAHLATGRSGEDAAYFHLRKLGYVMAARNWRTVSRRGELDMVGWDGETLCFIEVKTRGTRSVVPAELRSTALNVRNYARWLGCIRDSFR